jgi:hypothetical protein
LKGVILIIALLGSCVLQAQKITYEEARHLAGELVKKEILSSKGRDALLEKLGGDSSKAIFKDDILQFCYVAFLAERDNRLLDPKSVEYRIKKEDSLAIDGFTVYPPLSALGDGQNLPCKNCLSEKRSTIGFTRTRTLEDFKNIGLISDRVYVDCKKGLLNKSIKDEVSLLQFMIVASGPRD